MTISIFRSSPRAPRDVQLFPAGWFLNHYESYFRFITEPDIEPTNNVAEQAIRFVALHRRVT